ncbi:MAG TPA: hopanoid-associated sugar epimerase [Parvularculaceae bacterium]|nr:hopanoid-associated sugar epimerase [Parvularculaceae bacterium]
MVVLVTGATGFIGSAVARKLLERREDVRVLARPGSDSSNLEGLRVDRICGDLLDRRSLRKAMRGVEAVYHVAADYRLWCPDEKKLCQTNIDGTENIILAAAEAGARRIVYTSSVCTLGAREDGEPADETSCASEKDLIGAYKRSKFFAEMRALDLAAKGAPVVIVNPSTPIGPRDVKPTPTGRMVRDAGLGRIPAFVDTGLNFVHVDDVAAGHLLAHDKGRLGEKYILGGYNLALRSILALISNLVDRPPPRIELPRLALYPIAYLAEAVAAINRKEPLLTVNGLRLSRKMMYFTSAKAQRELGYAVGSLEQALADALISFGVPVQLSRLRHLNCAGLQGAA